MRLPTTLRLTLFLTSLSVSGCAKQTVEYGSWDGDFCLSSTPVTPGPAGEARWLVKADVYYDSCASGCAKVKSECKASVNGATIELLPSAVVTQKRKGDCPTQCVVVKAQCTLDTPLATGTYSVTSRDLNFQIEVPAKNQPCGPEAGIMTQPGMSSLTGTHSAPATTGS